MHHSGVECPCASAPGSFVCTFMVGMLTLSGNGQTNIWQDPYVKSEAVLFLYELDTDAHTAAMMMLQEEEDQDMFEAQDRYGFGFGDFGQSSFGGNGGSAGAYEIPQSLPPSMLSALSGSTSASLSASQGVMSASTGGGDHSASTRQSLGSTSLGVGSAAQDSNQVVDAKSDLANVQPDAKVADSKNGEEALPGPESKQPETVDEAASAECAHLPISLQDIDFLVTPHRGAPIVATRNLDGGRGDANGDIKAGNEQWEAKFDVEEGEAFVCVSAMASLHSEASSQNREVEVSILRLADNEQVCSSVLSTKQPSAIFSLGSHDSARSFVAVITNV